jgi:putative SOS response-associated peptidase YedK
LSQLIANAEDRFAAHPVSTRVNNVRNDSPDLLQRVPLHTMDALLTES